MWTHMWILTCGIQVEVSHVAAHVKPHMWAHMWMKLHMWKTGGNSTCGSTCGACVLLTRHRGMMGGRHFARSSFSSMYFRCTLLSGIRTPPAYAPAATRIEIVIGIHESDRPHSQLTAAFLFLYISHFVFDLRRSTALHSPAPPPSPCCSSFVCWVFGMLQCNVQ